MKSKGLAFRPESSVSLFPELTRSDNFYEPWEFLPKKETLSESSSTGIFYFLISNLAFIGISDISLRNSAGEFNSKATLLCLEVLDPLTPKIFLKFPPILPIPGGRFKVLINESPSLLNVTDRSYLLYYLFSPSDFSNYPIIILGISPLFLDFDIKLNS